MSTPDTPEERIFEALSASYQFHKLRDEMNGTLHMDRVRYSPLTETLRRALIDSHQLCGSSLAG